MERLITHATLWQLVYAQTHTQPINQGKVTVLAFPSCPTGQLRQLSVRRGFRYQLVFGQRQQLWRVTYFVQFH